MILGKKAVVALTGVSGRQVEYWALTGVVKPSAPAAGKGTPRGYSFKDLVGLKVAKRLKDEGISLQKIRKALVWLRRHFPDLKQPFAELRFITDGETVFLVDRDRESGPGQWRMQGHGLGGLGMVAGAAFGFHPKIGKNVQEISQFDATHDPGVDGHLPGGDILAAYLIRN